MKQLEKDRLGRRIAYMAYGPGRPAAHKFHDDGDPDVAKWRAELKKLRKRMREA